MGANAGSVSTGGRDGAPHRWAVAVLSDQGMPPEEIATMLDAEEPQAIHRFLELHRERLKEYLMGQRMIVELIEVLLTEATGRSEVLREGAATAVDRSDASTRAHERASLRGGGC